MKNTVVLSIILKLYNFELNNTSSIYLPLKQSNYNIYKTFCSELSISFLLIFNIPIKLIYFLTY